MALTMNDMDRFEASMPRLKAIAYRLLGSATDAEDAVQDLSLIH
ncbi:sigma factor, partial [Streptomyces sp. NRRL S-15]